MRLGILPAAGKAERWGGYLKELLPVSRNSTLLSRAVDSLQVCGCDVVVVVTNPSKVQWHAHHLKQVANIVFAIQKGEELWGAITTAIEIKADEYYFMMPDTFVPPRPFPETLGNELAMGLFATEEPERFGVVRDGGILDKQPSVSPGRAWGTLAWRHSVVEYWDGRDYPSHTEALNEALSVFGFGEWNLEYYYDIGSMKHYMEFLRSEHAVGPDGEPFAGISDMIERMRRLAEYSPAHVSERQLLSLLTEVTPHD